MIARKFLVFEKCSSVWFVVAFVEEFWKLSFLTLFFYRDHYLYAPSNGCRKYRHCIDLYSSVYDLVSSCLSSVQHLEDMRFNLSNTKSDGEEFVRIELLIPRKSFSKGNRGSNKCRKRDNQKVIIKTSNSIRKNQQVNSSAQCIDQNTTSKRLLSYDLKNRSEKMLILKSYRQFKISTKVN